MQECTVVGKVRVNGSDQFKKVPQDAEKPDQSIPRSAANIFYDSKRTYTMHYY